MNSLRIHSTNPSSKNLHQISNEQFPFHCKITPSSSQCQSRPIIGKYIPRVEFLNRNTAVISPFFLRSSNTYRISENLSPERARTKFARLCSEANCPTIIATRGRSLSVTLLCDFVHTNAPFVYSAVVVMNSLTHRTGCRGTTVHNDCVAARLGY